MITPEEFKKAQEVTRNIIEVCFDEKHVDSFKRNVIGVLRWKTEEYNIERIHMSGTVFRITIIFEDGSTYDCYRESCFVYEWFVAEYNKLKGVYK